MSFEKFNLPDMLLADLYKEGLVVIDKEISMPENKGKPGMPETKEEMTFVNKSVAEVPTGKNNGPVVYLGNNQQRISIIVNDKDAIHLQDELLDILSAILSACKFNLADVAIINMYHQNVNETVLKNELNPACVLLFGIETSQIELPFSIPDYKVQQFSNCAYLQAASLEKMKGNSTEAKLEKSKLWVCLKTLFNV